MPEIKRINVTDHQALGKLMIKWAQEPDTRPKSLAEFNAETAGCVEHPLPDWVKGLQFVQNNMETLLVRLPAAEMVAASVERTKTATGLYPIADFYAEHIKQGKHSQRDMLEFRVGDYTMAQCV